MDNEFIFAKKEMEVLITDSKTRLSKSEVENVKTKGEIAGGEVEAKRRRENTQRERARNRVKKAIKSVEWYANTQPEDQQKQVFSQENLEPLIKAILMSGDIAGQVTPELRSLSDPRRLKIAIMLASLALDECRRQIGTEYYPLFTADVQRIGSWFRALQIGMEKGHSAD